MDLLIAENFIGRRPVPTAGQRKGWYAGPVEPGNVLVVFFPTPIYE
ncbi:hypothetical protein WN990_33230 [Kitasatospora purpeofusca]